MNSPVKTVPPVVMVVGVIGILFLAIPISAIFVEAPWPEMTSHLRSAETTTAVRVSIIVSVSAAVISVIVGVPIAFILARSAIPGKALLRTLITVPLVLPPVVTGVALLAGFGRRSLLGEAMGFGLSNSMTGAILAATIVAMPFLVLSVEGALPLARWWRISLPMARPAIIAGAVLAWARALGEFGATIPFAGNIAGVSRTLPLEIAVALESDPGRATAVSLLMLGVSMIVLVTLRDRWLRT